MDQQVSMPTVSSYSPNAAASGLPSWTPSGEDYEGLQALRYAAQQRMPTMIQHSGEPRYSCHPDPTVMTTSRQKSPARKTWKRKSQISPDNARTTIIHPQGDATTVPMINYIPNSSGFMIPNIDGIRSLSVQHQSTMHNPSYLPHLPPSSLQMPQDHSQVVSARLAAQHPTQQPLVSHLTHSPLVVGIPTSVATSMALEMPAPTQLHPLTTQGLHWGGHSGSSDTRNTIQWTPRAACAMNTSSTIMANKPSLSSEELCPPTPIPEIPDDLTDADWNIIQGSTSGHTPKKAQAAQLVPPVSRGGVLSSNSHNNIACITSYCPQQVEQTIQNQKVVAPASTQELEQSQTAHQPQGVGPGVLSQSNILASTDQTPPQVAGNSPLPCTNTSEGRSSSIPTLNHHHSDTNSSKDGSSLTTVGVPTSTTQDYATTNSGIITQKSDQLPACPSPSHNQRPACPSPSHNQRPACPSPSHNQSNQSDDDDDCYTDSCRKPAEICYSPINPIIEKIDYDKELKLFHQHVRDFHRKRKLTAVLESENENETTCTCKNARKDSGGEDSLVPFILLMKGQRAIVEELRDLKDGIAEELRNLNEGQREICEGQREICEQIKNTNELLQTLSGPLQQVKMEGAVKTETQDNCMPIYALKEESYGIRLEDCCWKDENLLKIKGDDPCQYALKLLEKLFPVEDRVEKCYRRGPRSLTKPLLDQQRVKILENCIKYRFGLERFLASESDFGERINQKCRDAKRKSINKKE